MEETKQKKNLDSRRIYQDKIKERVKEIEAEYTPRQIKRFWRKDSLSYDMGISGHNSARTGDWYDIDYRAGQIVLFKNHIFNDHDSSKKEVYKLIKALQIPFDKQMMRDYRRMKRREKKYGTDDPFRFRIDSNIESRIYKTCSTWWYGHKKVVCICLGIISMLVVVTKLLPDIYTGRIAE